jgi:FkbM family methyltransferase
MGLVKRISALQFRSPVFRAAIDAGSRYFRHRDLVMRHGVGAGLRFNTADSNVGYALGTTEPAMQRAIADALAPGAVFYDIGACVGFFSVIGARLVGPTGAVYAFEPVPANVAALRHNAALNGFAHLEVFDAAVSSRSGDSGLQLVGNSTGAKLLEAGEDDRSAGTIAVRTVTIDELVASGRTRPPTALKVDVEGAELEVMRGAAETLRAHRPTIICEMHGKNAEYVALMAGFGYAVTTLDGDPEVAGAYWNCHTIARPLPA